MSKLRTFTLLVSLVALLGTGLWFLTPAPSIKPPAVVTTPGSKIPAPTVSTAPRIAQPTTATPSVVATKTTAPALSIGNLIGSSSLDEKAVMSGLARITLETDRSLDERTEALGHLLNLASEDPSPALLPLIANRDLPDALCDRILDDSLNAPPAWQTDACLAVLTHRKNKALKTRARDQLVFLLGTDHGTDLVAWTKAVALSQAPPSP
jgi:hypothetical protein